MTYQPLLETFGGETVLEAAARRLREWYGRPCLPVISNSERWRFAREILPLEAIWVDETADLLACSEAAERRQFGAMVICYPELAWCRDAALPSEPAPSGLAVRRNAYRSVLAVRREMLEQFIRSIGALSPHARTLEAAAGVLEEFGRAGLLPVQPLPVLAPWSAPQFEALDDRGAAARFLRHRSSTHDGTRRRRVDERARIATVLFVCGTSAHSGAEEVMLRLAAGMATRGIRTILSTPMAGVVTARFREHGGKVLSDDITRSDPTPENVSYFVDQLRRADVSVVHCTGPAGLAPLIAAHAVGCAVVYHVHWLEVHHLRHELSWARRIVACSSVGKACLIANGYEPEMISIVPNAVAAADYASVRERAEAGRTLVCVARFSAEKRHDLLLRAVARIWRQWPGLRVLLVGEQACAASTVPVLLDLVRQLGLNDIVSFLPFQDDVAAMLGQADCVVLTSDVETAPLCVLEAMAAGLPVVAPRLPGILEILSGPAEALLFVPGSVEDCVSRLECVLGNPALGRRLGDYGRRVVENRFTVAAAVTAMLDVMSEAMDCSWARERGLPLQAGLGAEITPDASSIG